MSTTLSLSCLPSHARSSAVSEKRRSLSRCLRQQTSVLFLLFTHSCDGIVLYLPTNPSTKPECKMYGKFTSYTRSLTLDQNIYPQYRRQARGYVQYHRWGSLHASARPNGQIHTCSNPEWQRTSQDSRLDHWV